MDESYKYNVEQKGQMQEMPTVQFYLHQIQKKVNLVALRMEELGLGSWVASNVLILWPIVVTHVQFLII